MDWTKKNDKGQNLLMQFAQHFGRSHTTHGFLKQFLAKGINLHEKDNNGKTVFDVSPNILFLRAGLKVDDQVIEANKEKFRHEQWLCESDVSAYDALLKERRDEFREERTKTFGTALTQNPPKSASLEEELLKVFMDLSNKEEGSIEKFCRTFL